jgi:hypothetical protein
MHSTDLCVGADSSSSLTTHWRKLLMKKLITNSVAASVAVAMCVLLGAGAVSADVVAGPVHVTGEKLDSGLGDLPHYSKWADPTGKNPLQARVSAESSYERQGEASPKLDGKQPHRPSVQVSRTK